LAIYNFDGNKSDPRKDEEIKLQKIYNHIINNEVQELARETKEWGSAGIIIMNPQGKTNINGSPITESQLRENHRGKISVITKYSKELSWLFYELRDAGVRKIDFLNKYFFYEMLATNAISYIEANEEIDLKELLLKVYDIGKFFLDLSDEYKESEEDEEDYEDSGEDEDFDE
jgi:hypothetical protein